jgi:hypothetical protein
MNRIGRVAGAGLVAGWLTAQSLGASAQAPEAAGPPSPPEASSESDTSASPPPPAEAASPAQPTAAEPTGPTPPPSAAERMLPGPPPVFVEPYRPALPPSAPEPDEPTPPHHTSSLELWGAIAPSLVFGDPANPSYAGSLRRVGVFGELGIAYRSSYFLAPFLAAGYADLASGTAHLPRGPWGAGRTLDEQLTFRMIALGITSDIWRFRLRFAVGLGFADQRFTDASEHTSSQAAIANQFGLGFNALSVRRFRLDAEAQLVAAPGAAVSFATLALVAHADVLVFD